MIKPDSDTYSCIEFHLTGWSEEFKDILKQLHNGKFDAYTFYYYMKDFAKRIDDLAEYVVNGN